VIDSSGAFSSKVEMISDARPPQNFIAGLQNHGVQSVLLPHEHQPICSPLAKEMKPSPQYQRTFFRAIGIYVEHLLHVALLQLENVRSYEKIAGSYFSGDDYGWSTICRLEKLVRYLQEVMTAPLSSKND
jgi:hypothetical protein